MANKKYLDEDGLAIVANKVNEKLKVVATMPPTPTNGQVVLYVGTTTDIYTQGGIYLYNGTAWVLISTADVESKGIAFKGTRSAYNTAKLIPEGSDGYIPSGALVIITDEGRTYVTEGTGSSQTLEPVANATFNGSHAEWNALTLAQKAMYNVVNFTDDSPSAYKDIYSTNEVKTNKVWIDGKPIYRKVVTGIGSFDNLHWEYITVDTSAVTKTVRHYEIICPSVVLRINDFTFTTTLGFSTVADSGNGSAITDADFVLTLEYTKTTAD